jgi:hypothetical protein
MLLAVRLAADHQPLESIFALEPDEVAGERDNLENASSLLVRQQLAPVLEVRRRCGRGNDLEVGGAVRISADHQPVPPVVHVIAQAPRSSDHQQRFRLRPRCVEQPLLGGIAVFARDHHETAAARGKDRHLESEILFFIDQSIAGRAAIDAMKVDQAGTVIVVEPHIE